MKRKARRNVRRGMESLGGGFLTQGIKSSDPIINWKQKEASIDFRTGDFFGELEYEFNKKGHITSMDVGIRVRGSRDYVSIEVDSIRSKRFTKALRKDRYQDRYIDANSYVNAGNMDKGIDLMESIPGAGDWSVSALLDGQTYSWD